MRALDTNVLVRALVQDDAAQGRRAQACFDAQPVYVPVTVVLELEWVLRSRYGYSPKAIADAIEKLAILENAVIGEQSAGAAHAQFVEVFREAFTRAELEEAAEGACAQVRLAGDLRPANGFGQMRVDVAGDPLHPVLIVG